MTTAGVTSDDLRVVVVRCGEEGEVMAHNANFYVDADGVLCIEVGGGFGDAIKLSTATDAIAFLAEVSAEINAHFGVPTNCDALSRPPTFQERHEANVATLQELHDMVWGDTK